MVVVTKGTQFKTGGLVTVVGGHPITEGLSTFANPDYDNYGGGVKAGATVLTRNETSDDSAAWQVGSGRAVYLGPIYLANWTDYANEALLDGTRPDAQELFLRSVEWAGNGSLIAAVPAVRWWGLITMASLLALAIGGRWGYVTRALMAVQTRKA